MKRKWVGSLALLLCAGLLCGCAAPLLPEPSIVSGTAPETAPTETVLPTETTEPETQKLDMVAPVMQKLSAALAEELDGLDSRWAVYVEDLATGNSARGERGATCEEPMVAASIIKVFIAAEAYRRIECGELNEEEIYPDLYAMLTRSDNDAANRMTTLLGGGDADTGMQSVTEYARFIGCDATEMNRLMLVYNGKQNYISACDGVRILRMICDGTCVSAYASGRIMQMLCEQYWNDYIPQGPPEGTRVAHKGGDLPGVVHGDIGVVFSENGTYLVSILCNDPVTDSSAEDEIRTIARLIDSYMAQRPSSTE